MPLVNVFRGEKVPAAPLNIRVPWWRPPIWLVAVWWLLRGTWWVTVRLVRHWRLTLAALAGVWAVDRFDWPTLAATAAVALVVGVVWRRVHPRSWWDLAGWPVVGRWRGWWVYRRAWPAAMATAGLAVSFAGRTYLPRLRRVVSDRWADRVTVSMLPGQLPDLWGGAAQALAHTFRLGDGRAAVGRRPDRVVLTFWRADPLAGLVPGLPPSAGVDLAGLAVGRAESGRVFRLRLHGTHILIAGATGAGKGSALWSLVVALAGGVRAGLVQVWAFDPKGGMELAQGRGLFTRFEYGDPDAMAVALEELVAVMRHRADVLRGRSRQHTATPGDPTIVVLVDELASLTAYVTDRKTKERLRAALSLLLSQGRAVGVHVIAALQDPRKEVLPFRDLFPTRVALRLTEPEHVDLVLGDGARNRGAVCDRIPESSPGVGYVVLDGVREPVRVRFGWHTDPQISDIADAFAPRAVSP